MGTIISSEVNGDQITFKVVLRKDEALHLKGHTDKIHLLTERTSENNTNIARRGKNGATKYFLIPRKLRKNLKFTEDVSCQRIDTDTKTIFVYLVDKLGL